jgi:hypothetical protein
MFCKMAIFLHSTCHWKKASNTKACCKKQKTSAGEGSAQEAPDGSNEDGSPEPVIKITAYIDMVVFWLVATGHKKAPTTESLECGPFVFYDDTDFAAFQTMVM